MFRFYVVFIGGKQKSEYEQMSLIIRIRPQHFETQPNKMGCQLSTLSSNPSIGSIPMLLKANKFKSTSLLLKSKSTLTMLSIGLQPRLSHFGESLIRAYQKAL